MPADLYQLEADEELRVEADCPKGEKVTVELKQGMGEVFGTEMVLNTLYTFGSGAKFSVHTFQGCQVLVSSWKRRQSVSHLKILQLAGDLFCGHVIDIYVYI